MIAIYTQNRQAVWNFADISRFHVTGNGTGIQAVAKNGAGGELARYKNREQCTYVLEMLMSAFDADERTFTFPAEKELEHAKQHSATEREIHAHWIKRDCNNVSGLIYECSNCNTVMFNAWNYCPYCGAKMDEKEQDNECI